MSTHSIYLIHDSGYDVGVKLGYIADGTGKAAWRAVPSYSPRPMCLDAIWHIPTRYFLTGLSANQSKERLESSLHAVLGGRMNQRPGFARTGQDWCWARVHEAVDIVSAHIGASPTLVSPQYPRPTNDNFRNPHPRHLGKHDRKIVMWIYRELFTERLKVQFVDDWRTPFERARRYSRNGIEELAAFTYPGPPSVQGNAEVFGTWSQIVSELGFGTEDIHYGWLREGVELSAVENRIKSPLQAIPASVNMRPEGVKTSYNSKY